MLLVFVAGSIFQSGAMALRQQIDPLGKFPLATKVLLGAKISPPSGASVPGPIMQASQPGRTNDFFNSPSLSTRKGSVVRGCQSRKKSLNRRLSRLVQ